MAICTAIPITVFDQESFHAVDRQVTGIAFDIHNEFGRYLDEKLYQRELTRRCRSVGLAVESELRITASFAAFSKDYFVDLLINQGVIIETKAASALSPAHRGQTLNYLFMCGLYHATLLNFRTERVQREFVSTRMNSADRRRHELDSSNWRPVSPQCASLRQILLKLLADWGAFLDPVLYRDALSFFLGDDIREINVHSDGEWIGTQRMHMLSEDSAFSVTASTHGSIPIMGSCGFGVTSWRRWRLR